MQNKLLLRFLFASIFVFSVHTHIRGQANPNTTCDQALAACPDDQFGQDIVSEVGGDPAPGDFYGCLGSQPNPLWYYIQVSESGAAMFELNQYTEPNQQGYAIDVDFCLWGPFESQDACNLLSDDNVVDSSYNPTGNEYIDFYQDECGSEPSQNPQEVESGDWYILLITNFSGDPGYISLTPSENNEAAFNCSILGETYAFCDIDGDGVEEVNLENQNVINDITGGDPNVGVTFHATSEDASNYQNPLNPDQQLTADGDLIVYARRLDYLTTEITIVVVTFTLVPQPEVQNATLSFCDNNGDGLELFDLTVAEFLINPDEDYTITFYESQEEADLGENPIDSPDYYESGNAVVFVRVEAADCWSTAEISLEVLDTLTLNSVEDAVCDTDGDGLATFNLSDFTDAILGDVEADIRYYENESDAIAGNDNFIADIEAYETSTTVLYAYAAGSGGCNATATVTLIVNDAPILTEEEIAYDYCDNLADGTETIDLSIALNDIIVNAENYEIYYFLEEADAQAPNLDNAIDDPTNFELTGSVDIYILLTIGDCSDYVMVNYTLGEGVPVSNDTLLVCNNDSGEGTFDLTGAEITDQDDATLTYFTSLENAENNENPIDTVESYMTAVPATVYVLVTAGDCSSIAEITLDYFEELDLTDVSHTVCDSDGDGLEVFNLNDFIGDITDDSNNNVFFYLDEQDAINGASNNLIDIDTFETATTTLYVRVFDGDCYAIATLTLNVLNSPDANDVTVPYTYCDNFTDGIENIDITIAFEDVVDSTSGLVAEYYLNETDAMDGNPDNAIDNPTTFDLDGTINVYVRVSAGDCYDVAMVTFELTDGIAITNDTLYTCSSANGQGTFDLTAANVSTAEVMSYHTSAADALTGDNPIDNPESYTSSVPGMIYVHVEDGECVNSAEISLEFYADPDINIPVQFAICSGSTALVDAGAQFETYAWSTGETTQTIEIDELGNYWVDLTDSNGCSFRHEFEVVSGIAPEIVNVEESMSSLTITAEGGEEPYEYSIGGFVYQQSNVFNNLTPGTYNLYVRGADGCISMVEMASIMQIPTVFTPNGDGINDVYRISGLEVYPDSQVRIYDRYGALVYEGTVNSNEIWDGKDMSGNLVSTQDYWYILDISDGRRVTGHVTVKRRTAKGQ